MTTGRAKYRDKNIMVYPGDEVTVEENKAG
jgi:hypothetical protein